MYTRYNTMFPTGFEPVISSRIRHTKGTYEETMSLRTLAILFQALHAVVALIMYHVGLEPTTTLL